MKADIQQFIGLLFASRDYAHKAHLNTDSFAEHMALNGFYDGIIDLADSLTKSRVSVVQDTRDFVSEDTVLSNIVDEIEQLYSSTIYKLKFLK